MTREQQPHISNEVLAERVERYFEQNRSEFKALNSHIETAMTRFEAALDSLTVLRETLHDHMAMPHHVGTRDAIVDIHRDMLDQEKAIGQLRDWKTAVEARREQMSINISFMDRLWVTLMASIPTVLLIYNLMQG